MHFRLTKDNESLSPVDARGGRAGGVHAKTRCPRQRGSRPPLKLAHSTTICTPLSASSVDSIDLMALKIHLNVPVVRLPIRKERKTRLRLLDSDDEDYEKGERVHPAFEWITLIDRRFN